MISDIITKKSSKSVFSHRFRHLILILTCLCLTSISSNMVALNFTIICMAPNNETIHANLAPLHSYTQSEKSWLNWAVGIGAMIGTFPLNALYTHFGARYVFLFAGILSAFSTVIIPLVAEMGLYYFIAARFFQGISYAGNFACIGIVCAVWAPLTENAIFIAVMTSFTPISSVITNPVAGILCGTLGWPSVYYTHAGASVILFILWHMFYLDKPRHHSFVSIKELDRIHKGKSQAHINMDSFVPYWEICKNPVILTIWFNALADIGTTIFIIMYAPTYFKYVLQFGITETGLLGTLPVFLNMLAKWASGFASDLWHYENERVKLVAFNTVALVLPGLLFFGLGYVPDSRPWLGFWLVVSIECFLGANCGGFYKCATLVSRQYSHFVIANIQFIKCITLFAAPGLVAIFVEDDSSREQWRNVFIVLGIVLIIANTIFCFMATDQPAQFTKVTHKKNVIQDKNIYYMDKIPSI